MPSERERLTGGQWPIKVWHEGLRLLNVKEKKRKRKAFTVQSLGYTKSDLICSPASGKFLSLAGFAKTLYLNVNLNRHKNGGGMPQI